MESDSPTPGGAVPGLLGARSADLAPRTRLLLVTALLVVAAAAVVSLARLPTSVASLHDWAAHNRALSPQDREIGARYLDISPPFLFAARELLPEDARFAVLTGDAVAVATPITLTALPDYSSYFLLPRRRVELSEAGWILCYGCDPPPGTTVAWQGADGSILRVEP